MEDLTEDDDDDEIRRLKRSRLALDQEEVEVYGSEKKTHFVIKTFGLEVCDSLLNVGPCGNMTMGEPAYLSDDFTALEDPDLELVSTSGYAKNGALCVLQRSIRPQIVTTIALPGIRDLWTLYTEPGQENHSLIVVSHENRTIVSNFRTNVMNIGIGVGNTKV
jgi:cleavage and polyadenylation specificity factor subunit 1